MKILNTADYITKADLQSLSQLEREAMYNGLDCCVTLELIHKLEEQLDDTTSAIYQRSLDLRAPIMEMSMRGIRVDGGKRKAVTRQLVAKRDFVASRFNRLCQEVFGKELPYRSNPSMMELFYNHLGLKPIRKRNAQGEWKPTINRDAVERLQVNFWAQPFCSHLLFLRDINKKIEFLMKGIDDDGRMRAQFNIAGTKTGRLASAESELGTGSNQQNIDRSLRSIFIPDDGKKFINIDLEQGDSRNLGATMWHLFYDQHGADFAGSYLDACESGDLHTRVAWMTWPNLDWPEDQDPDKMKAVAEQLFYRQDSYRQIAKKLGHGSNYRGQPRTMALHTKTPVPIITSFQQSYFSAFPCIPEYHEWIENEIKEYSFLTSLHGRRRYFFGRHNDPTTLNEAVAQNPQSMTADAVNIAMIKLWIESRVHEHPLFRHVDILCQVHDSLLLQAPTEMVDDIVEPLLELCKAPLQLAGGREFVVPNEAKVGFNWGDKPKKIEKPEDRNDLGLIPWAPGDDRTPVKRQLTLRGL